MDEEYTDSELGWHIKIQRTEYNVTFLYTNVETGEKIEGSAISEGFEPPELTIREHIEEQKRWDELKSAGVAGYQICRRVLEMVGELHREGFESLYLDSYMAPSGCYWRYEIGAMVDCKCPIRSLSTENNAPEPLRGPIGGGFDQTILWGKPTDDLSGFVSGFKESYPEILSNAKKSNRASFEWYEKMLSTTAPNDSMIFSSDYGPFYEYAYLFGNSDFKMPMPPGFVRKEF